MKSVKSKAGQLDKLFLGLVLITVFFGFLLFMSASLGLHARDGASFGSVVTKQAFWTLLGFIAMVVAIYSPYSIWKKLAVPIFLIATALMVVVLLPGVGFLHGGSRRWIYLGSFSFQPGDLFKIATVILYASWISKHWKRIKEFGYAIAPFCILLGVSGLLLFLQPKIGTFLVIAVAAFAMLIASGAKLKHVGILILVTLPIIYMAATTMPYVRDRVETFFNPDRDPQGESYQIKQSFIAVGSGGWFGRGYGQSIQKFNFLPEPIGDSIFAVVAEELGFVGATLLIVLIVLFTYRGLVIASAAPDLFGRLLVIGLVMLITAQSFINIAAMVGVAPITGMPLVFVSHGGTAMATSLASIGIILNVSRYSKLNR